MRCVNSVTSSGNSHVFHEKNYVSCAVLNNNIARDNI